MSYFLKEFGRKIKGYRELKGFSQEELSEMVDVSRNTIGLWENGKSFIEYPKLVRLCKALDIEEVQLFQFPTENANSQLEEIVALCSAMTPAKQKQILDIVKTFS